MGLYIAILWQVTSYVCIVTYINSALHKDIRANFTQNPLLQDLREPTKDNCIGSFTSRSWCTIPIDIETIYASNKSVSAWPKAWHGAVSRTRPDRVSIWGGGSSRNDWIVAVDPAVERIAGCSWSAIAIYILAVGTGNEAVSSLAIAGHGSRVGAGIEILAVYNGRCAHGGDEGGDRKRKFYCKLHSVGIFLVHWFP